MGHELSISDFTTRELKRALRSNYSGYWEEYEDSSKPRELWVGQRFLPGGQLCGFYATEESIRFALSKREHVPAKKEGKTIRRLMAQTGMTADELRKHPRFGQEIADAQNPHRTVITSKEAKRLLPALGRSRIRQVYKIKD